MDVAQLSQDRPLLNLAENSLWTLVGALLAVSPSLPTATRLCAAAFVTFMVTTDLPMYFARHRARTGAYRSVGKGVRLLRTDFRVSHSFAEWKDEMAWQGGYFSLAVWTSLLMCLK